jgi:hypothetical protein
MAKCAKIIVAAQLEIEGRLKMKEKEIEDVSAGIEYEHSASVEIEDEDGNRVFEDAYICEIYQKESIHWNSITFLTIENRDCIWVEDGILNIETVFDEQHSWPLDNVNGWRTYPNKNS